MSYFLIPQMSFVFHWTLYKYNLVVYMLLCLVILINIIFMKFQLCSILFIIMSHILLYHAYFIQFETVMNSIPINIIVHIFWHTYVCIPNYIKLYKLINAANPFFKVVVLIYSFPNCDENFDHSISSPVLITVHNFHLVILPVHF